MPETENRSRDNWLLACGPGCAVLAIAAVISGVVAWRASTSSFEIKRTELRQDMLRQFEELLQSDQLAPDSLTLIKAAHSDSLRPEVGYFGMLLYLGGVVAPLQDGVATAEDLVLVRETALFLKEHPAPTFWAYGDYVNARPPLQQAIELFKKRQDLRPE